ncbi:PDZ_3 domain-containing protein [Psidium guajava]|nr:PDZ_3 domain-containing protein [Psidium guajava]
MTRRQSKIIRSRVYPLAKGSLSEESLPLRVVAVGTVTMVASWVSGEQ